MILTVHGRLCVYCSNLPQGFSTFTEGGLWSKRDSLYLDGGSLDHPPPLVERSTLWQTYTPCRISTRGGGVPKLEVEGAGTFEVEDGRRLVLAIEEDAGVDILHDVGP
jgi:hypothetical protein